MAKGSLMLQLQVTEVFDIDVTTMPPLFALVLDTLDGDQTTVREISVEKVGGILSNTGWGDMTDNAAAQLYLVFRDRPLKIFYAPSHVPSPPFEGAGLAILQVRDYGLTVTPGAKASLGRQISAHAYLDEVVS